MPNLAMSSITIAVGVDRGSLYARLTIPATSPSNMRSCTAVNGATMKELMMAGFTMVLIMLTFCPHVALLWYSVRDRSRTMLCTFVYWCCQLMVRVISTPRYVNGWSGAWNTKNKLATTSELAVG